MLESAGLWIRPWEMCPADPTGRGRRGLFRRREIVEPASQKVLGFVSRRSCWYSWFTRRQMEVYETEDASLLLTLRGPGWMYWSWEVRDAEDRCRGFIDRVMLFDATGAGLAMLDLPSTGNTGKFVGPAGDDLGTFQLCGTEGTRLTFANELNPFARMVLLGAALSFG